MKKRPGAVYALLGVLAAVSLALTTDQIIQTVYNSSSHALTVKVVGGSGPGTGTVTGTGTANDLAMWSGTSGITNFGGKSCGAGTVATAVGVDGTLTCVTAGSTNITNVTGGVFTIANKSSTGTTVNRISKLDTTASPATAIIATTSDTTNVLGVCVSGCGTTGNATILTVGQAPCDFDNTATVGHYVIVSVSAGGKCHDSGSATTYPTGVAVLGIVAESGTTAAARQVDWNTPDVASASAGPNGKGATVQTNATTTQVVANFNDSTPAAAANGVNVKWQASNSGNTTSVSAYVDGTAFAALAYNGILTIKDIHSNSSSFTVAHRIEVCLGGSGNYTATMPASPTVGDTYTVINEDTAHTCILTRAGSQTMNGATTLTLAAYTAPTREDEHCVYLSSNDWVCEGPAT